MKVHFGPVWSTRENPEVYHMAFDIWEEQ